MIKVKNTNFVKELIDSDFLIVKSLKTLSVLNLMELNKEIKQFIRLLQFLIEMKAPLYIIVENKHIVTFINNFFENFPTKINVVVQTNIVRKTQKAGLILILEESSLIKNEVLFKKMFRNEFFLVNKVNFRTEKEFLGIYKIFNQITEIKKLVFILTIIRSIVK